MGIHVTVGLPDHVGTIQFDCPKGNGRCFVPIRSGKPGNYTWGWDGNREKPTITPSIDCTRCGWHGLITDGEIK